MKLKDLRYNQREKERNKIIEQDLENLKIMIDQIEREIKEKENLIKNSSDIDDIEKEKLKKLEKL